MWLIYALGGGWGHLTRAVSLARVAPRESPVRVLTNSPYATIVAAALPELDLKILESRDAICREMAESRLDCLIVDTFPRGIGGELADVVPALDAKKVLVHRDLNPRYVEQAHLRSFVQTNYDLVLVPGAGEGEQLGDLPQAVTTHPWLLRSQEELRCPGTGAGSVLICASGKAEEQAWYGAALQAIRAMDRDTRVRLVSAERPAACPEEFWIQYWPAIDLIASAAVVIGGAGYNTVHECAALGVPLVARPWPRMYDRQELRARRAGVTLVADPRQAAARALALMTTSASRVPNFVNGVDQAVRRILAR